MPTITRPSAPDGIIKTVSTTDATVTSLAVIPVPDNTVLLLRATIIARRTNAADRAGYVRRAVVFREAAGAATLQGAVDTPLTRESHGPWDATIDVNGNNVRIRVTGAVGHNVNWKTMYWLTKVG